MRVRELFSILMDIAARMDRYRELATRITGSLDGVKVQRDPEYSRVESAVVMIDGLSADADARAAEYKLEAREAEEIIDTLESASHRRLLKLRYINGLSFDAIKTMMGFDDLRWVFRLHGHALEAAAPELRRRCLIK